MAQQGLAPKGRSATVVVAAVDSRRRMNADLICDGIADEETIQLAYSYLPASGGKVLLLEGTYLQDSRIVPVSNSIIGGMGPGTIIKTAPAKYSPLTADKGLGETSVTVADGSQFKAGMDCTIFDDDHCTPGAPGNGICVVVTSVDGNTVSFTKTYGNDAAVLVSKNARLFSSFSNFHCDSATFNVSHFCIEDMMIDGNLSQNYAGNGDPYQNGVSLGGFRGDYLTTIHDAVIRNCVIQNHPCGGIIQWSNAGSSYNNKILNNHITCYGYMQPIHLHAASQTEIASNVLYGNLPGYLYSVVNVNAHDNILYCNGIGGWWAAGLTNRLCFDGEHINNAIFGFKLVGDYIDVLNSDVISPTGNGIQLTGTHGRIVGNNVISPTGDGIQLTGTHGRIVGNNVISAGAYGIHLPSDGYAFDLIQDNKIYAAVNASIHTHADYPVIRSNMMIGCLASALFTVKGAYILNNRIQTSSYQPVIDARYYRTIVEDNIIDVLRTADLYYPVIMIDSGADNSTIKRNWISSADSSGYSYLASVAAAGCYIHDNHLVSSRSWKMSSSFDASTNVLGNIGYVAHGEIRTVGGPIKTLTENAYNSLDNPFGQDVALLSLDIYISAGASATTPNIDCGIGASATTDYATLFDDLPGETPGIYNSKIAVPGTQTQPILWQSKAGNRYLNMSIKDAAATGMVATYVATVMGL